MPLSKHVFCFYFFSIHFPNFLIVFESNEKAPEKLAEKSPPDLITTERSKISYIVETLPMTSEVDACILELDGIDSNATKKNKFYADVVKRAHGLVTAEIAKQRALMREILQLTQHHGSPNELTRMLDSAEELVSQGREDDAQNIISQINTKLGLIEEVSKAIKGKKLTSNITPITDPNEISQAILSGLSCEIGKIITLPKPFISPQKPIIMQPVPVPPVKPIENPAQSPPIIPQKRKESEKNG